MDIMENLSLIVAVTRNSCIGIDNSLPWKQREDMKFFKKTTVGKAVIMGRKTFDSIGHKPLLNRLNIVISDRLSDETEEGIIVANSVEHAIEIASEYGLEPIVIGGASIYDQVLSRVSEIFITVLDTHIDGDSFFPELKMHDWKMELLMYGPADHENEFKYTTYRLVNKI